VTKSLKGPKMSVQPRTKDSLNIFATLTQTAHVTAASMGNTANSYNKVVEDDYRKEVL
jgi:hypothetical protein